MTRQVLLALAIGVFVCSRAGTAFAQSPAPSPLARGDVIGIAGWQNVKKSELTDRDANEWYNRAGYGAGAVGWYWTDHHKTEIELGASTSARFRTYHSFAVDNLVGYATSAYTFSTRRIVVGEQYQFFRNVWFHPHVGAGADLTWETTTEDREPAIAYNPQGGQTRLITPARKIGPDTTFHARPFGEVGFKAYMAPRAFFRSDLRLIAHRGIDEVQLRFGFGVDF